MWYMYQGERDRPIRGSTRYRVSFYVSDVYWIEVLADALTVGFFGWASYEVLKVFLR